jgi:tRNA synthetases class I (W and Y)
MATRRNITPPFQKGTYFSAYRQNNSTDCYIPSLETMILFNPQCLRFCYCSRPIAPRNIRWQTTVSIPNHNDAGRARVIFSGIQPTGIPHLGNYLGALRDWVRLQNTSTDKNKQLFSIVDMHALTMPQQPSLLRQWRRQTFAMLLAVGLDPSRSTIFYQSAVCFLAYILALSEAPIHSYLGPCTH